MFDHFRDKLKQSHEKHVQEAEEKREKEQKKIDQYKNAALSELAFSPEGVLLHKNEKDYYLQNDNCNWYEMRTTTKSVAYSGVSGRVKIAKGLYWHTGIVKPMRNKVTKQQLIHNGVLLITNKRILMINSSETSQMTLRSITNVIPYSDGLEIQKATGKNVLIKGLNGQIPAILITRIISGDSESHLAESIFDIAKSVADAMKPSDVGIEVNEKEKTLIFKYLGFDVSGTIIKSIKDDPSTYESIVTDFINQLANRVKKSSNPDFTIMFTLPIFNDALLAEAKNGEIIYNLKEHMDTRNEIIKNYNATH